MAITKREAKEIVDWVVSEIQRKGFIYLTDGKIDLSKSSVGTLSGNATLGGRIADGAVWDRHVAGEADIRGTKIRVATTSERGTVQFASNLEIVSAKVVQANDSRLHNTTVASATEHDARYYTESELGSILINEGAGLIGVYNPSGWWSGSNVQQALDQLHKRKFTSLSDVPTDYEGYGGLVVAVRQTEDGLEFVVPSGGGGSENFLGLTDTPNAYAGQQGKAVVVNDTENGLTFVLISGATTSGGGDYNPNRAFSFAPEFPNTILYADGTTNSGTMSLKYEDGHTFYDWYTIEPFAQDYDIVMKLLIPPDLDSMGSGIFLYNKSDVSVTTGVRIVEFLDSLGNNVITDSLVKNGDWTETMWAISGGATWYANSFVTLHLRMQSDQYKHSRIGEVRIPYLVKQLATQVFSFVPEYDGFVLEEPAGGENDGVLTGTVDNGHNAFKWSNATELVTQDYDIVVKFRIPPNFDTMGTTLYMWNKVSDTLGNTGVRLVEFLDTAGNNVITALTKKNLSWTEDTFAVGAGTWTVNGLATLRFRVFADNGDYAYLGEVRIAYTTN